MKNFVLCVLVGSCLAIGAGTSANDRLDEAFDTEQITIDADEQSGIGFWECRVNSGVSGSYYAKSFSHSSARNKVVNRCIQGERSRRFGRPRNCDFYARCEQLIGI